MQLKFNYEDETGTSSFTGNFSKDEVEYLLEYAVQSLMKQGVMSVQLAEVVEEDGVVH